MQQAPSAMLHRFFNSCFQKRPGRSRPQSPHIEASTETDSSDATLAPLQLPYSPKSSKDRLGVLSTEAHAQPEQASAVQAGAMPKSVKEKSARKSTKDKKPYSKSQKSARSDSTSFSVYSHACFPILLILNHELTEAAGSRYYSEKQGNGPTDDQTAALRVRLSQMFDELIPST
jgi:hypothetical protein